MPELPEVETTRRGIVALIGRRVKRLLLRERRLRWPPGRGIEKRIQHQCIKNVERRGKYLLIRLDRGSLIIHLGMSGRLHLLPGYVPPRKHDHIDLELDDGGMLRYTDPRRFGAFIWVDGDPLLHPLLVGLGPEPLDAGFSGAYLYRVSRNRKAPIKAFIMDSHMVVGVGNIYANEALFRAGILPSRAAASLDPADCRRLVKEIRQVLRKAIRAGGTTLRDFSAADGVPGYFAQTLLVYGRGGEPCRKCSATLVESRQGQRTTVFCTRCQH